MTDSTANIQNSAAAEKLKEIKELTDKVYSLKLKADESEAAYKKAKNDLSAIMEEAGVDKMQGDTCTASLALKSSVSCPKDDANKLELFMYLVGEDVQLRNHLKDIAFDCPQLFRMLTINAKTFSSWHQKEVEAQVKAGNFEFKLDMIEPYEYYSVGLRKRAKK